MPVASGGDLQETLPQEKGVRNKSKPDESCITCADCQNCVVIETENQVRCKKDGFVSKKGYPYTYKWLLKDTDRGKTDNTFYEVVKYTRGKYHGRFKRIAGKCVYFNNMEK